MKHLNKLFVAVALLAGLSSQAQDSNNPWAISFGVNAVDTRFSAASKLEDQFSEFFNAKDHWNILPSVSYLNVSKYVGSNFSFGVTGSVNKIKKFVLPRVGEGDYPVVNPGDLNYYAVDGVINYSFMNLIGSKVIDPSAHIGGGYTWFGDASAGTVNGGLGLTFWFAENVGLSYRATYKHSFDDTRTPDVDVASHVQHFAGLTFKFGGKDTDGDGIYDKDDACPDVPGLEEFQGCPDTDGDGIADKDDSCPDTAGLKEFNGCPDTDGDGIIDSEDACVDVPGTKIMKGCPDADGDGVADKDDECPEVAGLASNKGCPEVTAAVLETVSMDAKSIYFNTGKATFRSEDVPVKIESISALLKQYPTAKFSIEGHTDSVGSDAFNQKLSQERADVVKNALIERGMKAENLSAVGYGESKPVATNKTAAGKAKNRRTEVVLQK